MFFDAVNTNNLISGKIKIKIRIIIVWYHVGKSHGGTYRVTGEGKTWELDHYGLESS